MTFSLPSKRGLLLIAAALIQIGCASHTPTTARSATTKKAPEKEENDTSFDERIAKLKLGMSRSQVTSIMDDEGRSVNRSLTPRGSTETVIYIPNFGQRYATALKRDFSFGFAGRSDPNSSVLIFKDGRLFSISSQ